MKAWDIQYKKSKKIPMKIKQTWCCSFPFFSICRLFQFVFCFIFCSSSYCHHFLLYDVFFYIFFFSLVWFDLIFLHTHAVISFLWYTFCNGLWMHKLFAFLRTIASQRKIIYTKKLFHFIMLYIVHCAYKVRYNNKHEMICFYYINVIAYP